MTHSIRIIVLNVTKTGDKSLVIHSLSREFGRRSFIVSVGRNTSMALFLPLNILEVEVSENSRSDLWRMRNISACHPLGGIRDNLYKNTMTLFMSEVLYRTIRDGASEDGLCEWCERSILTLDAMESDFSNYHLRFLLELGVALGFRASIEDVAPFAGSRLREISDLIRLDFSHAMLLPLSGQGRYEIAEALLEYLGYHIDSRIEVRSLDVLHDLLRS